MGNDKITISVEVAQTHKDWLDRMAVEHALPDADKTLRVLLDYAIQEGNADEIFDSVRCRHC